MWLIVIFLLTGVAGCAWLLFAWRRDVLSVRLEGREAYQRLQSRDPDNPMARLDRHQFVALYERAHRVRMPKYVVVFIVLASIGTVPVLMLLSFARPVIDFGPVVFGFIMFFTLIIWWTLAFGLTMMIYHKRRPGTLEDEFKKLTG
jgi:hypothetical protein